MTFFCAMEGGVIGDLGKELGFENMVKSKRQRYCIHSNAAGLRKKDTQYLVTKTSNQYQPLYRNAG